MGKTFRKNKRKPIKIKLNSYSEEEMERLIEIWKKSEDNE